MFIQRQSIYDGTERTRHLSVAAALCLTRSCLCWLRLRLPTSHPPYATSLTRPALRPTPSRPASTRRQKCEAKEQTACTLVAWRRPTVTSSLPLFSSAQGGHEHLSCRVSVDDSSENELKEAVVVVEASPPLPHILAPLSLSSVTAVTAMVREECENDADVSRGGIGCVYGQLRDGSRGQLDKARGGRREMEAGGTVEFVQDVDVVGVSDGAMRT